MGVRVAIDKASCQSSGNCTHAEPEAFGWDDDDLGEALPGAGELPLERLRAVAHRCPAVAITLLDESGNEIDPGR